MIYFFGYGSLMFAEGINGRGMEHKYIESDLHDATIDGFKRELSFEVTVDNMHVRFYGLKHETKRKTKGVIFPIHSIEDLEALMMNEGTYMGGYRVVQVPVNRIGSKVITPSDSVFTLICDYHFNKKVPVFPGYLDRVCKGLEKVGKKHLIQALYEDMNEPKYKKTIKKYMA